MFDPVGILGSRFNVLCLDGVDRVRHALGAEVCDALVPQRRMAVSLQVIDRLKPMAVLPQSHECVLNDICGILLAPGGCIGYPVQGFVHREYVAFELFVGHG